MNPNSQAGQPVPTLLGRLFPFVEWIQFYSRQDFQSDLFAGLITAILLVPQGMAYAMLAGLPPQVGLYASILPPVIYAIMGTSRTLSVGPVSIAAIMVARVLSAPEISTLGSPISNAIILAAESGMILLLMSAFKMGMLVNFISHPVLTGFTSGAALLIIFSQIGPLLGLSDLSVCGISGDCYLNAFKTFRPTTAVFGLASVVGLLIFANPLSRFLQQFNLQKILITGICKSGPLFIVAIAAMISNSFGLDHDSQIKTIGTVPTGLPALRIQWINGENWRLLFTPALFIALIAYVESVAIAKVTANRRRQRINPNRELVALGASNIAASISGGMPVAGGFSRTMVNFSAGAVTQVSTLIAATMLGLSVIFFTDLFGSILKTSLAAVILVAIWPLVKLRPIITVWRYNRSDGLAEVSTFIGVLLVGIEQGLGIGILITLLSYLWRTSRPHIAVVGQVENTQHFRNIKRHSVKTWTNLIAIRVDENLTFANAACVEDFIHDQTANNRNIDHIVLIFTSISHIDSTGLEMLEHMVAALRSNHITLHLTEVKGPVMDDLQQTNLITTLAPGKIYFSTSEAIDNLAE